MERRFFLAAVFAALTATQAVPVQAAPQILAALPLHSGIALSCENGICAAQLTTYCLQRERPAPGMGAAYVPAKAEHFTLVLTSENGNEVRLPAGDHMRFTENRGFMSIAASIEFARLNTLGADRAHLVVWDNASLIPVAEDNDPNPLTPEEIAYVTDSLREHGKTFVDRTPQAGSAQLLAQLNAALPAEGYVQSGGFEKIWQQAIGDDIPIPTTSPAYRGASEAYDNCARGRAGYSLNGLKQCLDFKHDDMIRDLNIDYWENQPGS